MKPIPLAIRFGRNAGRTVLLASLAFAPTFARAQAVQPVPPPAASPANAKAPDEVIALTPFEVTTDKDTSYGALNSNSVTRFNTELDKVPISDDIFTEQFMTDVGATSVTDMLQTYGAGVGTVLATPASDANLSQPGDVPLFGDRFTSPPIGVRGLSAGNIRRNGFNVNSTNTNSTSNFDIERVEVLRGPQGLLYGAGGPGGTIVSTTKRASFARSRYSLGERIDQFGSKRTLFDANYGADRIAIRVAALREDNQQRRLFIGDLTEGYYGQIALRLPLNTVLRVNGEFTYNKRTAPTGISVNFGNTTNDPRSGESLAYLVATGQSGANNPATGQPFSKYGAVDNGHLDWFDYASYAGWMNERQNRNRILEATAETVWTKWLSTSIGYNFNTTADFSRTNLSALAAPLLGGNPYNEWAVNSNMQDTVNQTKHRAARASALITQDFFHGNAKTQSSVGYDYEWTGSGPDDFGYYLADSSGNVVTNPAIKTDLGRTLMGVQWWPVIGGPQLHPLGSALGAPTFVSPLDGKTYVRTERNPKNPAWVSPTNPFGTASLQPAPANAGVGGINASDYQFFKHWTDAYYFANYTRWWDDRFATLVGYRTIKTTTPIGSGGNLGTPNQTNASYNLGIDGRINGWLRAYYSFSSTYNDSSGFNDFIGTLPPTSNARGHEVGLKFSPARQKISGSLAYYYTDAKNQNTNFNATGSNLYEVVNPTGINGVWRGPQNTGRNNWVPVSQTSSGLELILTAAPTRNWRIRFSATKSDGKIGQDKKYQFVYNDQFYTDSKGGVTYKDGSPVLVPTNGALVAGVTSVRDPATVLTAGVASTQLTTAMMGDPTSDYYAWGKGNPANLNGQINSGVGTTTASDVGNVLRFFNKPGVGTPGTGALGLPITAIQYAWPDPGKTGGFYTVTRSGDKTVGYPVYRISLTNSYEFTEGRLKGLGLTASLNDSWNYRTYYYNNPDGTRALYTQPSLGLQINLNPYYQRKIFRRYLWRTQVDIVNLTNHYLVELTPNNGFGFTRPANIGVMWNGQPRSFAWTNSISF
jgi:outer membrane receptor protein involved in Fe transport